MKSVPDCYKNQEMRNRAVYNYPHAVEYVTEGYKTQTMCDKDVDTYPSTIKFLLECFMTQNCEIKQLIDVILYLSIFLIGIKIKKFVTELFLKILF